MQGGKKSAFVGLFLPPQTFWVGCWFKLSPLCLRQSSGPCWVRARGSPQFTETLTGLWKGRGEMEERILSVLS